MRLRKLLFLAFFLGLFLQDNFAGALRRSGTILSPTTQDPIQVTQGGTFSVLVNMRLPLTPPPGVQQPAAKTGWFAALTRTDAIATDFANAILDYPATVVRYRPDNENVYRVTIETNPWTPPGSYDLVLKAPGLEATALRAIIIGKKRQKKTGDLRIKQTGPESVTLNNHSQSSITHTLDLIVPKKVAGFEVKTDGKSLEPKFIAWAGDPPSGNTGRRLLHFEIKVPPRTSEQNPGTRTVTWTQVEQSQCSASIDFAGKHDEIDPTVRTPLSFRADNFNPVFFAWDFGDGAKATGQKTNHLFMLTEPVNVRAFAFDYFGRICTASAQSKTTVPLTRTSCDCIAPGQSRKTVWFYLLGLLWK